MEVYPLSDNKFIGSINSYDVEPSTSQLYMLTPRDPSDFVNKKIITIASGGYLPTSKIGEFNRSQSQYRIVAKDYAVRGPSQSRPHFGKRSRYNLRT